MQQIHSEYQTTIDWLFQQFPSYQKIGASAYKPDLGNIKALIEALELDFNSIKFIHLAGTNGKGTCTNYIGSILIENEYRAGIFTSPHIVDFRERIIVNGKMISEEAVINFCNSIKNLAIEPSFFEITFAMALSYFIEEKCEFAVIETGLGGRLDATNIINPILSVITNIGLDHVQLLGDNLPQIAKEKAGIIKPNTPVIIGEYQEEVWDVFVEKALEMNAPIELAADLEIKQTHFKYATYKQKNEKTILKTVEKIQSLGILLTAENIEKGFENIHLNTTYKGRFQIHKESPLEIIDVAHNENGINELMESIKKIPYNKLHIIYGTSSDKNYLDLISLFPDEATIYFCEFNSPRSLKLVDAEQKLAALKKNIHFFKNISEAYSKMENTRNEEDLTLITGSFFLVSDFFEYFF